MIIHVSKIKINEIPLTYLILFSLNQNSFKWWMDEENTNWKEIKRQEKLRDDDEEEFDFSKIQFMFETVSDKDQFIKKYNLWNS